jgi:hypothetical protein
VSEGVGDLRGLARLPGRELARVELPRGPAHLVAHLGRQRLDVGVEGRGQGQQRERGRRPALHRQPLARQRRGQPRPRLAAVEQERVPARALRPDMGRHPPADLLAVRLGAEHVPVVAHPGAGAEQDAERPLPPHGQRGQPDQAPALEHLDGQRPRRAAVVAPPGHDPPGRRERRRAVVGVEQLLPVVDQALERPIVRFCSHP